MARRKKIKGKRGDVFTFPLKNNLNCFGQIVATDQFSDNVYILFDFAAKDIPDHHDTIISKPVLAIALLLDFAIEDGEWPIIGNTTVAIKNLVLPYFLISLNPVLVEDYHGNTIREATDKDLRELSYRRSYDSYVFELLANHRFAGGEWDNSYDEIFYVPKKWTSSEPVEDTQMLPRKDIAIGNPTNELTLTSPANEEANVTEISIRYMLDSEGFGTPADLERRYQIEDLLDEHLRNAGLGECGGTETGEGFMFVYCYVTDPDKAIAIIKRELEEHGFLEGAVITRSDGVKVPQA